MDFVFERIVGWNSIKNCSFESGGLFGKVLSYAGGIETQGNSTLHGHYLIWIDEFSCLKDNVKLNTTNSVKMNNSIESDCEVNSDHEVDIKNDRLIKYANSMLTTEYSMLRYFKTKLFGNTITNDDVNEVLICPKCCYNIRHEKIPMMYKSNKVKHPPIIATCVNPECNYKYNHITLRKQYLDLLQKIAGCHIDFDAMFEANRAIASPLPMIIPGKCSDENMKSIITNIKDLINCRNTKVSENYESTLNEYLRGHIKEVIIFSTAIVLTYEHKYKHHGSCFKKGVVCRYWVPHELYYCTIIGSNDVEDVEDDYKDDKVNLQRCIGCEYMNAYSDVLFMLTKSNCDISVLRSHNGDYSIKYVAKPQDTVDSTAVVHRFHKGLIKSFEKRYAVESANTDLDVIQKGKSRLYSLIWHYTNMIEICTTMACCYILRNTYAMQQSHKVSNLLLTCGLVVMNNDDELIQITSADKIGCH